MLIVPWIPRQGCSNNIHLFWLRSWVLYGYLVYIELVPCCSCPLDGVFLHIIWNPEVIGGVQQFSSRVMEINELPWMNSNSVGSQKDNIHFPSEWYPFANLGGRKDSSGKLISHKYKHEINNFAKMCGISVLILPN